MGAKLTPRRPWEFAWLALAGLLVVASCSSSDAGSSADTSVATDHGDAPLVLLDEAFGPPEDDDPSPSLGPAEWDEGAGFFAATIVAGGRVIRGVEIVEDEPTAAMLAASCRNLADARADRTLDASIVVLGDPALYRSAELLDGEYAGQRRVALEAEFLATSGMDDDEALSEIRAKGFSDNGVEIARRYLEDRRSPPTSAPGEQHIAYAVNRSLTSVVIVRMAADYPLPDDIPESWGGPNMGVTVSADAVLSVPVDRCGTTTDSR